MGFRWLFWGKMISLELSVLRKDLLIGVSGCMSSEKWRMLLMIVSLDVSFAMMLPFMLGMRPGLSTLDLWRENQDVNQEDASTDWQKSAVQTTKPVMEESAE